MVNFSVFIFFIDLKIMRFGVMCDVPGFGRLFGHVFPRLAMQSFNLDKEVLLTW